MTSEGKVYFGSQCQRLHLPCSKSKASVSRQKEHEPELLISQTNQEVRCGGGAGRNRTWYYFKGPLLMASFCQLAPHAKSHEERTLPKVLLRGDQELKPWTCRGHHRSQQQQLCLIWSVWFGVFGLVECWSCHCCCRCLEPGPYYGTQPGLELITPLPPVSKYWNHRCILPHLAFWKWIISQQKRVA